MPEPPAKTLKLISQKGRKGFYEGAIAELIAEQSSKKGGYITLEDLSKYEPQEREPVYGEYLGYQIISMGPPSFARARASAIVRLDAGLTNAGRNCIIPRAWPEALRRHRTACRRVHEKRIRLTSRVSGDQANE